MSKGTLIHGIGASEHLDSSGERISIEGLDISSLERGEGVLNYEHKNENASHIVGKVILAKKVFSEKDCKTEQELYFWNKSKAPFLYIVGELFDSVGHQQAQEIAAMLRYDSLKRKEDPKNKNVVNFSVEGAKLDKKGNEIVKAIARKVSITIVPCNKAAVAEELVSAPAQPIKKPENPIDKFFKSEPILEVQVLTKSQSSFSKWSPSITSDVPGKQAVSLVHPVHGVVTVHQSGKEFHVKHGGAFVKFGGSNGVFSNARDALGHAKKYTDLLSQGHVGIKRLWTAPKMGKNLGAAPGAISGSTALAKETLIRKIKKSIEDNFEVWPNSEKLIDFVQHKNPSLSKNEASALAKMIAWKKMKKAEKALEEMEKGVAQRLFPFNPEEIPLEEKKKINEWQDYEGEFPPDMRETLPSIPEHIKQRALLRLSGKTQVRRNPETGEREFLLHRGVLSGSRIDPSKKEYSLDSRTSWTWDPKIARKFTSTEGHSDQGQKFFDEKREKKGHLVSAWIPESKIAHIPSMYGQVNPPLLEYKKRMVQAQRTSPKTAEKSTFFTNTLENTFANEGEVIVEPHSGKIVPFSESKKPSIGERLQARKQQKLAEEIKGKNPFSLQDAANFVKDYLKPKKLAQSESTKKALTLSEKSNTVCDPVHEGKEIETLKKPYHSEAQRRWAHTPAGTKALGGKEAVKEWDESTKGKKLPEKVEKNSVKKPTELDKKDKSDKPFHGYNKEKHSRTGGLSAKYRKKYNREHGSNLKAPVTEKNPTGKKAARKKSFCARMKGVKGPTSKEGKLTPKGAALKRWRC